MDPVWQSRWEELVRKTPELGEQPQRRDLLDCLRDFPVWSRLNETDLVDQLRTLPSSPDRDPVLAVLAWMRGRATTRHSPATRGSIDALEAELRSRTARALRQAWKQGSPFPGLNVFHKDDAPIFFGREAERKRLAELMAIPREGPRFTAVVGASGAGKSSLVRAGLWAGLEAGDIPELPDGEHWLITAMKPFEMASPRDSLAAALLHSLKDNRRFRDKAALAKEAIRGSLAELTPRLLESSPPAARWLLILDQMEELFTSGNKDQTTDFLTELLTAAKPPSRKSPSRFQVLATLRADFEHYSLEQPALAETINSPGGRFLLLPPTR
jgi:hypothetical protein